MSVIPHGGKLVTLLVTLCTTACFPLRRAVPANELPRRVVLALDGIDYRDVIAARQRGRFTDFAEPARLISTFPSISDIAWHAIFGVQPPPGYQRVYYSTRHNATLGNALSAIRPIEYEERMDQAFDAKWHHLGAYLISWPVARREVDTDITRILASRGRETVYFYNIGPDALQHTRGDIARYLDHLDVRLSDLQRRYGERTGRKLEIVLLSDHGHNRAVDAAFVPVVEELAAHGFRAGRAIDAPNDVAFSVDGVTTGFGVFCTADSISRVAGLLAAVRGVDLVTTQLTSHLFVVESVQKGFYSRATIERRAGPSGAQYRYHADRGDPLRLAESVARMAQDGRMSAEGFADAESWVSYTAAGYYPAAVVRIVHGHTAATRNSAPILVSLEDGYRVGLGMVSVVNRMRPLGGTHGALSVTNAVGVAMSNSRSLRDDVAMTVRHQLGGFDDVLEPRHREPAMSVVAGAPLREDRLLARQWSMVPAPLDSSPLLLVVLPAANRRWAGGLAQLRLELKPRDAAPGDGIPAVTSVLTLANGVASADSSQWVWRATTAGLTGLVPGTHYTVRLWLDRRQRRGPEMVTERSQLMLTTTVRAARDGTAWSY